MGQHRSAVALGLAPDSLDIIKMVQINAAALALCAIHHCFGVTYNGGQGLAGLFLHRGNAREDRPCLAHIAPMA